MTPEPGPGGHYHAGAERGEPHGDEATHRHEHGHGLSSRLRSLLRPHRHTSSEAVDALQASEEAMRALKLSVLGLAATAALQLWVVTVSGSAALLADTMHNFADAATAIPLAVAFWLGRRPPNRRYTYGYGRAEDLAGIVIVAVIALSSAFAAWEAGRGLVQPQPVRQVGWVAVAGLVGFVGNEAVAEYRIRVGRRIGSAALVADGYHSRTDGLTSLAVVVSAVGAALGFPAADPLIAVLITVAILFVLKDAARHICRRLMDSVDPELVDQVERVLSAVPGIEAVSDVRIRWVGHELRAEARVVSDCDLPLSRAHDIAEEGHHRLLHEVPRLSEALIHSNPRQHEGVDHHADLAHHFPGTAQGRRSWPIPPTGTGACGGASLTRRNPCVVSRRPRRAPSFKSQKDKVNESLRSDCQKRSVRVLVLAVSACLLLPALSTITSSHVKAQTPIQTSWIANSFGGGKAPQAETKFVQHNMQGMTVDRDGTVYANTYWDEAGSEAGVYREGEKVGVLSNTHDPGRGRLGGRAVAVDDKYVYLGMVDRIGRYNKLTRRPAPFPGGMDDGSQKYIGGWVTGIAAADTELYVSSTTGRIRVLNKSTMAELRSFGVPAVDELAWDGSKLWAISGTEVRAYSPKGEHLATIRGLDRPKALAIDRLGRLLVADDGPRHQIAVYAGTTRIGAIGVDGGMYQGPPGTRGTVAPLRFLGLEGLGTDSQGRLYVGMMLEPVLADGSSGTGGVVLRGFNLDLTQRWELLGLAFMDSADVDPASESGPDDNILSVHTSRDRFEVDLSKPVGKQWTWKAHTVDRDKYAWDHRTGTNPQNPQIHHLGGRKFMFTLNQNPGGISWYRFDGEIAVLAGGATDEPWPQGFNLENRAFSIDATGSIWSATMNGPAIYQRRFEGVSAGGAPRFSAPVKHVRPGGFQNIMRLHYDAAADAMFVAGYTSKRPGRWPGMVGTEIVRYDNWTRGNRIPSWSLVLPYKVGKGYADTVAARSMTIEGELIFTADASSAPQMSAYDAQTGALVRRFDAGPEVGYSRGWIDMDYAIRAHQRNNGEYLVFSEEDAMSKVLMYRLDKASLPTGSSSPTRPR